jgi:hypothetical protein
MAYNDWARNPTCPANNNTNSNNNAAANAAPNAAAEAETAAKKQRDADELEQERVEAENQRHAEEAERQAKFDHDKREALGELKGAPSGSGFDSGSGLKGLSSTDSGLKSAPSDIGLKTINTTTERKYIPAGNGLIGGTTWTVYASRTPGEPEQRMCDAIKQQSKLAGATYDAGVDCKHYQFVLGMAISVDSFTDLSNRVVFDDLSNGQFTAHDQGLYNKLRGKQFDELGCHSNGAMICLAALENKEILAENVVLYGPQVTRESLEMWNKLVQDGRIKSVKIYLNQNDPVPGLSIAYADYKNRQIASERPLFQVDALKQTINETAPRLLVQTFPCTLDRASLGCHSMAMYKSKVNCGSKPSGNSVAGTALHGKDDLPEPPLPCAALGATQ